jgi:hypothetical protein
MRAIAEKSKVKMYFINPANPVDPVKPLLLCALRVFVVSFLGSQ